MDTPLGINRVAEQKHTHHIDHLETTGKERVEQYHTINGPPPKPCSVQWGMQPLPLCPFTQLRETVGHLITILQLFFPILRRPVVT